MPSSIIFGMLLIVISSTTIIASGQSLDETKVPMLTTAQRLVLQEIDAAVAKGEFNDALDRLLELASRDAQRLVPVGSARKGFQLYLPLDRYLQQRLLQWRDTHPELLAEYRRRMDGITEKRLDQVRLNPAWTTMRGLLNDYLATTHGTELLWDAAQLALTRGWNDEATGLLLQLNPKLQAWTSQTAADDYAIGFQWNEVLEKIATMDHVSVDKEIPSQVPLLFTLNAGSTQTAEAALQLLMLERARGNLDNSLGRFFLQQFAANSVTVFGESLSFKEAIRRLPLALDGNQTKKTDFRHSLLSPVPIWSVDLPDARIEHPQSQNTSNPIQVESSLFPARWQDKLLVATGASIRAIELSTGKPWPVANRSVPLWRFSGRPSELSSPLPLTDNIAVQHTVEVAGNLTAFRFGSPVTGWPIGVPVNDQVPSKIAVIDLNREGRLIEGFPWQPPAGQWKGLTIEGSPIIVDGRMYLGLTRRDGVLSQSFVGCIDLNGKVQWLSQNLAEAREANSESGLRLTHAKVCYDQGRLFYQASLGSVACLSPDDGRMLWLTTYPRAELSDHRYGRRSSAKAKQLLEVVADGDRVFSAPADCDRVFALSRMTGQAIWATAPGEATDAKHLLGVFDGKLILSGDRLYWIDRVTGAIDAAFPASTSQHPIGLRPNPRGVGRGTVHEGQVYFPVRDSIYVFRTKLSGNGTEPELIQRIELKVWETNNSQADALLGGRLSVMGDRLILSTASRLTAFPMSRKP